MSYLEISHIQQKLYNRRKKSKEFSVRHNDYPQDVKGSHTGDVRTIRAKNTGNLYTMDADDWHLVKNVPFYEGEKPNILRTMQGQSFEDYVGIVGDRLYPFAPRDKRREHYKGA